MRIMDLPVENRPRERLEQQGVNALSNAELIAIILKTGNRSENVVDFANRILSKYTLDRLSEISLNELLNIKGLGKAKACQIMAAFQLGKRLTRQELQARPVRNSADIAKHYLSELGPLRKEHFLALFLDSRNRIIKEETVSIGILNSSLIHARELFRPAVVEGAASLIIIHNHPSGSSKPSQEDQEITEKLVAVSKIFEIPIIDHIIIGRNEYFSFRDHELI